MIIAEKKIKYTPVEALEDVETNLSRIQDVQRRIKNCAREINLLVDEVEISRQVISSEYRFKYKAYEKYLKSRSKKANNKPKRKPK